jgi:2'-deoxynucleoside 5'-phosphate N-hydrolase
MKIYFAGSIRGGRDDKALYLEIIEQLNDYGRVLTEHIGDAELSVRGEAADNKAIHDRDLSWLKESDYVVAEVTTPSLGVGYELGKATEWGKPVLCLYRPTESRVLSAMVSGSAKIKLCEYQSALELRKIFDEFFGPRLGSTDKVSVK